MMTTIFILLLITVALGLYFNSRENKAEKQKTLLPAGKERVKAMRTLADRVLLELNCHPHWEDNEEGCVADYDYQNGHFRMHIESNSLYVKLNYLFFFNTSYENLNIVRSLCNETNLRSNQLRVVYSVNETKNEVDLHFFTSLLLEEDSAQMVLVDTMGDIFLWQNAFVKKFEEDLKSGKANHTNDIENERYDFNRKQFLMRQQEIMRDGTDDMRISPAQPLALGTLLEKALGLIDITPLTLTLYYGDKTEFHDNDILQFNLADAVVSQHVVRQRVVMNLTFTAPEEPDVEQWVTIQLNDEGYDNMTQWFRATMSMVPQHDSEKMQHKEVMCQSLLLALDKTTDRQRLAEFDYMWKDAQEKLAKGEEQTLTDEQKLICSVNEMSVAEALYWGNKYFLQGRYYEALLYLEFGYRPMQARFGQLKKKEKEAFFETCYLIGFCYTELKQYDKACYYLEIVHQLHLVRYSTEYVNALVNGGDFRAMFKIDEILNGLAESQRNADEQNEEQQNDLQPFVAFLMRRKAYVFIERRQLEEAKKILTNMLDDPNCHDFAINELAYIQKLENQK